jgi:aarF domain-containing kinase
VLIDFGLTKHVPRPMRIAFARLLISAAELDYAGLLMAINEMGLPVSIEDPADAMDTMRYLLRDAGSEAPASPKRRSSGGGGEGGSPVRDDGGDIDLTREVRASSSTHCAATGKRYPSLATPGSVLFLVRVISCLRGMAVTLDVQHSYLEAMRPYAKQALRDAFAADRAAARDGVTAPQHQQLSTFVAPRAAPSLAQDRVVAAMVGAVAAGETLGVQACVYHEGRLLLNCAAGELGVTDPRHVQLDSLFCAFSCGKTVCAALLHVLADKGLLSLDERVASFWPEYGCHGKEKTTVRMVLEHRSGLAHVLPELDQGMVRKMTDWRYMVDLLAASEPTEPVGEFRYHYLTYGWLIGGIAERVVARRGATSFYAVKGEAPATFAELVDEHIVLPLRLTGQMYVGLPDEKDARAAEHVVYQRLASVKAVQPGGGGEAEEGGGGDMFDRATGSGGAGGGSARMALDPRVFNDLVVRRACIPAANMHFTAHALATIYAALAADGSVGEARLLSARYASELQRALRVPASDDNPIPFGLRTFDLTATPGAFGFNGMANSVGLAHPGLGSLSVVVLVNQLTVYADAPKRVLGAVCEALGYELPDWGGLGFQEPGDEDDEAE